jgi:quinol monooxygenase YgiN
MIRHIVFFTAKSADTIDAICEGLMRLAQIPHSLKFEVSRNSRVDLYGNEIDVVVYAEFVDQAALDAYKAHPIYAEATALVRPLRDLRYAADIAVSQ